MASTSSLDRAKPHPLYPILNQLLAGESLLPDTDGNLLEVVGILKSYGVVLGAYSRTLVYTADEQFLKLFPFFKYFEGEITLPKLFRHWWHDRINYEYAEYCMRCMLMHGGGKLDSYLDSEEFIRRSRDLIRKQIRGNLLVMVLDGLFPEFLLEQVRQAAYTSGLGQFWRVMSALFLTLSDRYDHGEIRSIPEVVQHIQEGLVEAANKPITFSPVVRGERMELIPESAGLTFLMDTAVPYVEAVFFRSLPFMGTTSYNAQAEQIPHELEEFNYGALFADPLPTGSAGIPPTLLMQDMRHFLPDYLHDMYRRSLRGEDDLKVQICDSFQKSMFCVTTAALRGLAPYPFDTQDPEQQQANRAYLEGWLDKLAGTMLSRLHAI